MVGSAGKRKRKELELMVDGLIDFSLSASAAKSPKLGLQPIMEEPPAPVAGCHMLGEQISSDVSMSSMEVMMETAMSHHVPSEDMALVLYKPVDNPQPFGPGVASSSFIVSPDLIRGLKNHAFNQTNYHELPDNSPERSNSLALVPWAPPQIPIRSDWVGSEPDNTQNFEALMEADDAEVSSMADDAEVSCMDVEKSSSATAGGLNDENLHQWQHFCMTPPLLPNPSGHVMWSR